jgi:hypothetical protein
MDLLRIGCSPWTLLFQPLLQPLDHESQARELLAEVIVQVKTDALAFLLGDVQQFLFEALALLHLVAQLGVGFGKRFGAPGDAHFQFIPGLHQLAIPGAQFPLHVPQFFVGPQQLLSGGFQALVRLPAFRARHSLAQLSLDCGHQPGEVALHQIIVRAGLHCLDGDILSDVTRHDNEGEIQLPFLD